VNLRRLDPSALVYHELRAPLGLVATAAQSMADEVDDDEVRERCRIIVRAAERMLRTAATVADLGSDSAGTGVFRPGPLVEDVVQMLRGHGVRIDLYVRGAIDVPVAGSAERFEALLHSLVSNALDHGEPGSTITVTLGAAPGGVTVDIANDIALRDTHRGSGLGLLIASALARGLGARLDSSEADDRYVTRITLRPAPPMGSESYGDSLSTQSA
jgi:signal transduction histidine kinase